jgi:hypothetical protein
MAGLLNSPAISKVQITSAKTKYLGTFNFAGIVNLYALKKSPKKL